MGKLPIHELTFSAVAVNGEEFYLEPGLDVTIGKDGGKWVAVCPELDIKTARCDSVEAAQIAFEELIRGFLTGRSITAGGRSTTDGLELRSQLLDRIHKDARLKLVKEEDNNG